MSDLEKIHVEISAINVRLATMETGLTLQIKNVEHDVNQLGKKQRALDVAVITGNGDSIKTKLDRLEQTEGRRARHLWLIWGSLATIGIKAFWSLIDKD